MWRFRRSDAYLRNDWSNYTNTGLIKILYPQSISTTIDDDELTKSSISPIDW